MPLEAPDHLSNLAPSTTDAEDDGARQIGWPPCPWHLPQQQSPHPRPRRGLSRESNGRGKLSVTASNRAKPASCGGGRARQRSAGL